MCRCIFQRASEHITPPPCHALRGTCRASFDNDDDCCVSSDDDEPFLTQPPLLRNSIHNAETETAPFLDSVRRVIDNESEFNYRNQVEYTSPPAPPSIVILDYVSSAIRKELQVTWGCSSPRSYQIEAIFHLVYQNTDMMYLIRKTGEANLSCYREWRQCSRELQSPWSHCLALEAILSQNARLRIRLPLNHTILMNIGMIMQRFFVIISTPSSYLYLHRHWTSGPHGILCFHRLPLAGAFPLCALMRPMQRYTTMNRTVPDLRQQSILSI